MPTREDMRGLAQEIIKSYDTRARDVAQIRKATQAQLKEFDESHQAMARRQRTELANQRSKLATGVANQLHELDTAHQAMAQELRANLTRERSNLATSVENQLQELATAHRAMARELRADLGKVKPGLAEMEERRKAEVNAWMGEVAGAHAAAQKEWQNLVVTMQAKRGAAVAVAEAPTPAPAVAPVGEAKAWEEPEGEGVGDGGLLDQVFAYLADHPDGTRLVELEREFGLNRLESGRVVRSLIDDGKVEKRDLLYFAI